jgi:hypothetical protein
MVMRLYEAGDSLSVWQERFRKSYEAVGTSRNDCRTDTARTVADTFGIFLVRVTFVNIV